MYKLTDDAGQTLTLWDSDRICPLKSGPLVLWRQFLEQEHADSTVSICDYLERNGLAIRTKLLRLIFDVASSVTDNQKTNHLFRTGFDYFWMTQFHSRPYTQSAQLNNLAKIFALFEIIQQNKIKKLVVYSDNNALIKVFKSLVASLQIELQINHTKATSQKLSLRNRIKNLVPRPLLAILALVTQLKTSIALRSRPAKIASSNAISFFDYWYRFAESVGDDRKFGSQYWSELVDYLEPKEVNWWHNLVDQHKLSELNAARSLLTSFNNHPNHRHDLIDSKIGLRVTFRTIFDHGKLVCSSIPSKKYRHSFTDPVTGINFWPLLKREWLNSLRGYEALLNCLRFNRLESLFSTMPKQKIGFYLIENQPWEMALINLWRKHGHGKLVGVAHSTVRFWDLRLMSDTKQFSAESKMPRPDCIAVNGKLAKASLIEAGYPETELIEVEALMYLHLAKTDKRPNSDGPITILVATDYLESATKAQMRLLEELVIADPKKYRLLLKPHWSQSLKDLNFKAEIVSGKKDLSHFFDQADVLYCSAITSAVIDGVCAGLPVIQCLDPSSFNLSPLRDNAALQTVRNTTELRKALGQIDKFVPNINPSEFFNLDRALTKWKNLLQI